MKIISIIIPTFNETNPDFIKNLISRYLTIKNVEIIIIEGGKDHYSYSSNNFKYSNFPNSNRAQRINFGLEIAIGDILLIHHPRSSLCVPAILQLQKLNSDFFWGGFLHKFDNDSFFYKFTSWYSNNIRAKLKKIIYLDHCIFFTKSILNTGIKVPEVNIFEDTLLSYILRKKSSPAMLNFHSVTSSVRFKKNGFIKQALMNQKLKIMFHLNFDTKKMDQEYEKDLFLNSKDL